MHCNHMTVSQTPAAWLFVTSALCCFRSRAILREFKVSHGNIAESWFPLTLSPWLKACSGRECKPIPWMRAEDLENDRKKGQMYVFFYQNGAIVQCMQPSSTHTETNRFHWCTCYIKIHISLMISHMLYLYAVMTCTVPTVYTSRPNRPVKVSR